MNFDELLPRIDHLGLLPRAIAYIQRAMESDPSRVVGAHGHLSIRGLYTSTRLDAQLQVESRGVELPFLIEQDLDPNLLVLVDQPPQIQLRRQLDSRRVHVANYTPDFLVVSSNSVRLVECKPASFIREKLAEQHSDWALEGDAYVFVPAVQSARELGIKHVTVTDAAYSAAYCANLELLSDYIAKPPTEAEQGVIDRVLALLSRRPRSAEELHTEVNGATLECLAKGLVQRNLFGLLRCFPISVEHSHRFMLYSNGEDAARREAEILSERAAEQASEWIDPDSEPLLTCSASEFKRAEELHEGYLSAEAGVRGFTRHERRFHESVRDARATGRSELEAFLPHYSSRGNRDRRVMEQLPVIKKVIEERILIPTPDSISQALGVLDTELEAKGLSKVSRDTLSREVNRICRVSRVNAQQGRRAANAIEPPSDPLDRHMCSHVGGLIVHADSTPADNRMWAEVAEQMGLYRPIVAVAVCAYSRLPMAMAFVFGHASRYLTALLLRDFARRHGYLARYMFLDRGSEYANHWLRDLHSKYRAHILDRPATAPRWGEVVENLVKQLNYQLLRRVPGSTANDTAGRSADGSHKSRRTATLAYQSIRSASQDYLFGDYGDTPQGTAEASPRQMYLESRAQLSPGVAVDVSSLDFLIVTAVPAKPGEYSIDPTKGLRYGYRTYTSPEMHSRSRESKLLEVRIDPEDPRITYIRFESGWEVARSNDYQKLCLLDQDERLVDGMHIGIRAGENRDARRLAHQRNAERINRLLAAQPAGSAGDPAPCSEPLPNSEPKDEGRVQTPIFPTREVGNHG